MPDVRKMLALEVAYDYGQTYGEDHKSWVIDQMVRALTGDGYAAWVTGWECGQDVDERYTWDVGVPP